MNHAKLIIELRKCDDCVLYSRVLESEPDGGYVNTYYVEYCNGEPVENISKQFGSKKCVLLHPKEPEYKPRNVSKIIYVEVEKYEE